MSDWWCSLLSVPSLHRLEERSQTPMLHYSAVVISLASRIPNVRTLVERFATRLSFRPLWLITRVYAGVVVSLSASANLTVNIYSMHHYAVNSELYR